MMVGQKLEFDVKKKNWTGNDVTYEEILQTAELLAPAAQNLDLHSGKDSLLEMFFVLFIHK